jgi:hypothetical protein
VTVATAGHSAVGFQLAAGTLAGTLTPEVSFDGGTTWVATSFDDQAGARVATRVLTNPNAAAARSLALPPGVSHARVRVSSYTSGTANGSLRATDTESNSARDVFSQNATVAPVTGVASPTAAATLLAANQNRLGGTVYHDGVVGSAVVMYLKAGANASATDWSARLYVDDEWEVPAGYQGVVTALWSATGTTARCTEYIY